MSMLYPSFMYIEHRGQILPYIRLPRDFVDLIPRFYEQGRRETVDEYARTLERITQESPLKTTFRLQWDTELGLTNISIGPSGGLDLNNEGWPKFQEHNLGTKTGFTAGSIAIVYVSELLKSK